MKIMLKRTTSFLLTLAMLFAMLPAFGTLTAYATALTGSFDEVSCPEPGKIRIAGWGADVDSKSTSVDIHVYVGGASGSGAPGLNLGQTTVYRSDVNTVVGVTGNHGFDFTFTTSQYGNQEVYVYAGYTDTQTFVEIGHKSVYITPPEPPYGEESWNLSKHDDCPEKPDGVYRIASAANPNYSLDIDAAGLTDGTNLQLYSNVETDAQLFHLRRISYVDFANGKGIYEQRTIVSLMNVNSQLFLDKDSNSTNVQQYGDLANNAYRQWVMHNNGDGTYSFESVAQSGYFMTIEGGRIEDSANIGVAPWTNSVYQKFYLNAEYVHGDYRLGSLEGYLKTGEYRIWRSGTSGRYDTRVLDISNANKDEGIQAQIWEPGDAHTLQQIFDIQKAEEGWYTIRNISSGLYLATASGAAGRHFDFVQQLNTNSDAAKWAFVPRVRTDGSLSYWIVNKATGLYLLHVGDVNGSPVVVAYVDNSSAVDADWRSWGMEACLSAAPIGTVTNGATGIAADQFDTSDTISLPIKIFDYNDDGLLFEYSLTGNRGNDGFSLVAGSTTTQYPSWTIGRTTFGKDIFGDQINSNLNNYFVGSGQFWNSSPDGLNNMYMVTGNAIDLEFLAQLLNYSVYGEMISGNCTMGLVKPTLREVDGNRLMEYNDEVVAYVADLLEKTLIYREQYENGTALDSIVQDVPLGTPIEAYGKDTAGLLLEQLKASNGNTLLRYSTDSAERRGQIYTNLVATYSKQEKLIGKWADCKQYVTTYTDAAYFILNNLFYPKSYNMPQDKFDYLVLSKAKLSNGKTGYVFDSDFSDTYNYVAGTTKSAVKYDFTAKTISNTSMLGRPLERAILETAGGAHYTFLPVWASEGVQNGFNNPYTGNFQNKNYSYALQCNGKFTYIENDDLFFDFEGDDDVYLFINGQLVLDIGGAHGATAVSMNLNDYVYAARAKVAAGTANDRDIALALVDGEDYSFDFYYMERRTAGANMRIATNIRVSDPNLDTDKKAYQGGLELNNGGLVNENENVEYSFKLTNPQDSTSNLYHLTFADAKLGVTIDSSNGLKVNGSKTLNSNGATLTAADLKVYFTNQQGVTSLVTLDGDDKNEALKTYLKEVNGHGLLPGCSIEIRGIYYNIDDSDFVSGRFTNTLHVTANQKADGSGDTYQDSVNMVVCITSGPQYYQWSDHSLSVTTEDFTDDVNALLTTGSALLEQIAPATSLGTVTNLQLCDMKGNVVPNSHVTASADGISINYSKPGTYVFYVKATQDDNSTVIIPVQVYVTGVEDSVFVLDYGLKVDLSDILTAKDTVSVAGKSTYLTFEATTKTEPSYADNHITFPDAAQSVDGTYGKFVIADGDLEYQPNKFMEGPDSVYVAIRVYEGKPGATVGTVNINTEVEMYKKITILPANVVYYEDDFPAITYLNGTSGDSSGDVANTITEDGGSGTIYQSADQSGQYGYDDAYDSGTSQSGASARAIQIKNKGVTTKFTFTGTGFELISRCLDADKCAIYLSVFNSEGKQVKGIPVIMEYDNQVINNEGIYQVPVVRVDDLTHGTYTVQIRGIPAYTEDDAGNYVIDTTNPPTLYIDGLRIYNPLSTDDSERDYYLDGEDTASFLEIRDLILEGKAAAVTYNTNDNSITTGTSTSIFTENRNGKLYSTEVFEGNVVNSVNDYLVFGPNNELYLGGKIASENGATTSQALAFYITPDDPETIPMLQVGVHVLNDQRLFGSNGELTKPGILYQGANTGAPGWKVMDDNIASSTERYYSIDLSICDYDETNNRYEVVLYCEDGYLSFTNLKVSGGTICTVNGEAADMRYNNGVLEMLVSETSTWTTVPNPEEYVNFASLSNQMCATVMYEPDEDTGEFVPVVSDDENPDNENSDNDNPDNEDMVTLVGRSLLFKDIIKMRFYFDISATGVTTATPENSGLLVWTEEEYAALDCYTVDTAGAQIRGLTNSVNGYYADSQGIPAKNMVDQLYVCAYVILPDGSYAYSEITEFSPVMYAQLILEMENSSESMKELVIALMNYGAAAQVYFNYKTDTLMNDWLTDEQKNYAWSDDLINVLPADTSKYTFTANDQIVWRGSSVTFVGAVNQNFYFQIPEELMQGASKVEFLYWTESDYNELSELTVDNARKVAFNVTDGRAVIEGTAAKALGNAFYFAVHIVYEDGEAFSEICVDSAHDYARRVLSSDATSDAMKELAKALVYYSCKAKNQLGG